MTQPYDELLDSVREASLIGSTAGILAWDQETMLPKGGVEWRARQLAQLASIGHEMWTSPRIGDLITICEGDPALVESPHSDSGANLRELRRNYDRQVKLPQSLVAEIAKTQSLAQHAWTEARAKSDFQQFRPWLEKMVELMQQKAACIGFEGDQEAWDVLLEGFEPGARATQLQDIFTPLRERLTELIGDLLENGTPPAEDFNRERLPIAVQEEYVREVAKAIGFDSHRGRIDRATHPFCSGSHPGDVRITTRFHEDNVVDALGSTMHEAGHGMYEQGMPVEHAGTPLGQATSLGVHESQSRLWENHVGRSRAFWQWCHPLVQSKFGAPVADYSAEDMYRAANVVRPDFIRVEADEATYNLHVIVRFEIELALLRGDIAITDVPAVWNEKYRDALGIEVPDDARGCLQDVHWSCGLFGYFPTYTLGNLFAAQLFEKAEGELPDLHDQFSRGEFTPLREWLGRAVHEHGSRYTADELCERATGEPLGMDALLRHLEGKLRPVYGL
jgi:carboxypeptidase Taq